MPVWGSWSLFFAVCVACSLVARWLDRMPAAPSREVEDAHRPSLPDAVQATPPPPHIAASGVASNDVEHGTHGRDSRPTP